MHFLLNANHPRETRALAAAHECGHLISTRNTPEILHADEGMHTREERYADAFARAFLIPTRAVKIKFQEMTAGSGCISRRLVVVFAHSFGVSNELLVRRLVELGFIKDRTWDWLQSSAGITDQHTKSVPGDHAVNDVQVAEADLPTTLRLSMLAAEAHRRDLLTEEQLRELLRIGRIELRKLIDDIDLELEWPDEEFHTP